MRYRARRPECPGKRHEHVEHRVLTRGSTAIALAKYHHGVARRGATRQRARPGLRERPNGSPAPHMAQLNRGQRARRGEREHPKPRCPSSGAQRGNNDLQDVEDDQEHDRERRGNEQGAKTPKAT